MQIQRFPAGLIDLLNIKQGGGRSIEQLETNVKPTMDLTDAYSHQVIEHTSASDATWLTGVENTSAFVVPQGQLWYLYAWSGAAGLVTINDFVKLKLSIRRNNVTVTVAEEPTVVSVQANQFATISKTFERPWIVSAGDRLQLQSAAIFMSVAPSMVNVQSFRIGRVGPDSTVLSA